MIGWLRPYLTAPIPALLALGFASGLPLALTASTLSVWLTEAGVNKASIGLFAAVAIPYTAKFLWAPLVDSLPFPILTRLLGRRRGWLIGTQMLLAMAIVALAFADPSYNPWLTALVALLVTTMAATQDIVIDAFRVELLPLEEQGRGLATFITGYRLGMIASGAGALFLASSYSWTFTYMCMASLLAIGTLATLLTREPERAESAAVEQTGHKNYKQWFREAVVEPMAEFMRRRFWITILLFVFFYKFCDAFIGIMTYPFLLEIGFSKPEIAEVAKLYGMLATIAGGFIGGEMVRRMGIMKPLWYCGIAQGLTNLVFIAQAKMGANLGMLAFTMSFENAVGGAATAAFVAYLSALCNLRFTATQYALLSSIASAARTIFSTPAGWCAEKLGWEAFFLLSAILSIPGLVVLVILQKKGALPKTKSEHKGPDSEIAAAN